MASFFIFTHNYHPCNAAGDWESGKILACKKAGRGSVTQTDQ